MSGKSARTIALVDFRWEGHHPTFFRHFYDVLGAHGDQVVCFYPAAADEPAQPVLPRCGQGGVVFTDEVLQHRWIRKIPAFANWFRLRQTARALADYEARYRVRFDVVCFACWYNGAFPSARMADALFPYRWTGLLLDSTCVRWSFLRRALFLRTTDPLALFRARKCISLATLDEFIAPAIKQRLHDAKPVHILPEIVDTAPPDRDFALARRIVAAANGRAVIGCFGQFARRKGALDFIATARFCEEEPWFFVWAGPYQPESFSAEERALIERYSESAPANCMIEFGRVSDGPEFNALVDLSSTLFLYYPQHIGSSNVVAKAAHFGKPVIVCEGYCMGDQTRRYRLGECVPANAQPAGFQDAIRRALSQGNGSRDYAGFQRQHSIEQVRSAIAAMTRRDAQEHIDANPG